MSKEIKGIAPKSYITFRILKNKFLAFSRGPVGFRELREAYRKHFHLSWYLSVPVVMSYGQKSSWGGFFLPSTEQKNGWYLLPRLLGWKPVWKAKLVTHVISPRCSSGIQPGHRAKNIPGLTREPYDLRFSLVFFGVPLFSLVLLVLLRPLYLIGLFLWR